jgi:tRNA pseudouridine38-40 synthase
MLSDIVITDAEEAPENFHARFDAVGKTYRYVIKTVADVSPLPWAADKSRKTELMFARNYAYCMDTALDTDAMREAAEYFVGEHDFGAFRSAGGNGAEDDTVRTIYGLDVRGWRDGTVTIDVTGNGFLYNMVRIIVGTLVETGLGKRPTDGIPDVIASRDRRLAGHRAPAGGLYLMHVYYGKEEIWNRLAK